MQNGLSNISGNDTLSKYQGQLVYPGMTATLDDHSIQPISYARRNIDKSTSMRMNWTQAAVYKRNVRRFQAFIRTYLRSTFLGYKSTLNVYLDNKNVTFFLFSLTCNVMICLVLHQTPP